jgi:hypothetical protein
VGWWGRRGEAAAWQIRQIQELLRQAGLPVIFRASYAAVMTATAALGAGRSQHAGCD